MRIWTLALTAFFCWLTASVDADYFRFIYIPGAAREKDNDKDKANPGGFPAGRAAEEPGSSADPERCASEGPRG